MAQQQPARRKMQSAKAPVVIPDKLYFRIGDVARLCSLPAYVLRFWETEFSQLKPNKGGTGQRLYRKRDVETVLEIKRLLYDEGFTIAGARRLLGEKRRAGETAGDPAPKAVVQSARKADVQSDTKIKDLRKEMRELLAILGSDPEERKTAAAVPPIRKESKKTRRAEEPTLF